MWGVGGLQVRGICSRRLVCKVVVEALSNYEKQEILILVIWKSKWKNARISCTCLRKEGRRGSDLVWMERL